MGSGGFRVAAGMSYKPGEIILEVGSERDEGSTSWLAEIGPPVVTVDVNEEIWKEVFKIPNVEGLLGMAEDVLVGWDRPIKFCWLDGHDWPYDHVAEGYWNEQKRDYELRMQDYSMEASSKSHLEIVKIVCNSFVKNGILAIDDTWYTEEQTWDGKGREAVPFLLENGFSAIHYQRSMNDKLVLLRKD